MGQTSGTRKDRFLQGWDFVPTLTLCGTGLGNAHIALNRQMGCPPQKLTQAQSSNGSYSWWHSPDAHSGAHDETPTQCSAFGVPWQCLNFFPESHGHGSLRPTLGSLRTGSRRAT